MSNLSLLEMLGWYPYRIGKWMVYVQCQVPSYPERLLPLEQVFLGPSIVDEPPGGFQIKFEYVYGVTSE